MRSRGTTAFWGGAAVFAIWGATTLWMQPATESSEAHSPARDTSLAQKPPPTSPLPVDAATSILGTSSSLSVDALALVLLSTSPGNTPHEGSASLGTDVRNPQTYAAGATLSNGALIREIHADHIVLELAGKRSVLALRGNSTQSAATTVGGAERVNLPLDTVPSSRQDLSEILRPEPVYEGDRFAGLRILPGSNRGKLAALGLAPGDIVRGIEGKRLQSPDESWQLLDDALSTGVSIVVSIERDGSLISTYLDGTRLVEGSVIESPDALASLPNPGIRDR